MVKDKTPVQEKQYYVLVSYKPEGWKKGQVITIPIDQASSFIGPGILTPLRTALEKRQYVPKIESAVYTKPTQKPKSSLTAPESKDEPKKKTLIKNTLRNAVQEKKQVEEETPEIIEEQSEKPIDTSSSSAAEDAIKAKIAAAKKDKKK